jgi:pyruvate kinase
MLAERRAKIVATIGPSTSSREDLKKAIQSGMNVARLNFSHGKHEEHLKVLKSIRELSIELQAPVSILQDLQGPKVRVGRFEKGSIDIVADQIVTITIEDVLGKSGLIPSDFKELAQVAKPGVRVLLDDGLMELEITKTLGTEMKARVIYGGTLKDRKGMNLPGVPLPIDCLTEKDRKDLDFGIENDVDYVALSFVRKGQDIRILREILESRKSRARIIAKIEMVEALENLEEIIRLSDAVMVARGDLAVEVGSSRLPGFQKKIIKLANQLQKPVITATQMLDSMVENPRPTRAEITDVANAVLDGSDALMLSAESASGHYPFVCIRTMHEIITEVEKSEETYYKISMEQEFLSIPSAIGASACLSALKLNAKAIVCLTTSGKTANIITSFRPQAKVIAVTDRIDVLNQLELIWGIQTFMISAYQNMEDILKQVDKILVNYGLARTGDRIILTLGQPIESGSKTNALFVHIVGAEKDFKLNNQELPLRCQSLPKID